MSGVPFTQATIEATGGSARDRGKNIFVLGLLSAAFNLDREKIVAILSRQFGKKDESVLRNAMLAFDAGYAYQVGDLEKFAFAPGEANDRPSHQFRWQHDADPRPARRWCALWLCVSDHSLVADHGNACALSCRSMAAFTCRRRMNSQPWL